MRTIDADAFKEKYGDYYAEEGPAEGFIGTVGQLIDNAPTVEERPKGKWMVEGKTKVYCTHCNEAMTLSRWTPKFVCCPYCGADMRGDV